MATVVQSHLRFSPAAYDREIRRLIPLYDELLREAAAGLQYAQRPVRRVADLGMGTGVLTKMSLSGQPRAGFAVDVPGRRSPFAVIVGVKDRSRNR